MKKNEIVFFALGVVFFGFMLVQAAGLASKGRSGEMGSGSWPLMALSASAILSIALLIDAVRKSRQEGGPSVALTPEAVAERRRQRTAVTLSVVCFLLYLVAIPLIGFVLATFLFIPIFALALGERRKSVLLISPPLLTLIIVAVFAKFITIPFPRGIGIFAELSRLIY